MLVKKEKMNILRTTLAVILALPTVVCASNVLVTQANFEITAEGGTPILYPGTVNGSGCTLGAEGGCESSTALLAYIDGGITSSASGTTSGGVEVANASANATGTFFFEVVGPPDVLVPLIITASGTTAASGPEADGSVQLYFAGGSFLACSGTGSAEASCGSEATSFSGSQSFSLTSNTLSDVELIVAGSSTLGSGGFSASADEMVVIDPTFVNGSEFSLVFSADVPEPSTLPLVFVALAMLAGSLHRGRR